MISLRLRRTAGVLVATAGLAGTLAVAVPSSASAAAAPSPKISAAATWLAGQFENAAHKPSPAGDHFDAKYGKTWYPNYGENADAIFGLVAAGGHPAKVTTALQYLAKTIGDYADLSGAAGGPYDGSIAKVALAAEIAHRAGLAARAFGGHNLLAQLKADECSAVNTKIGCGAVGAPRSIFASISDSFAILAEARAGFRYGPSTAAVDYFLSLQCKSSGFTSGTAACGSGAADLDSTSYAVMALQALGGHSSALTSAESWLTAQQKAGGYWISQKVPNANSTGLAAAALAGSGKDVSKARGWLRTQQIPAGKAGAGAIRYAGTFVASGDAVSPSVLATAQALTGLAAGGSLATLSAAGR